MVKLPVKTEVMSGYIVYSNDSDLSPSSPAVSLFQSPRKPATRARPKTTNADVEQAGAQVLSVGEARGEHCRWCVSGVKNGENVKVFEWSEGRVSLVEGLMGHV